MRRRSEPDRITRVAADATGALIMIEDHCPAGGLGEAVLADRSVPVTIMTVRKTPMSGQPEELRDFEEISASAIVRRVGEVLGQEHAATATAAAHVAAGDE